MAIPGIHGEVTCYDVGPHQLTLAKPDIAQVVWRGESKHEHLRMLYDLTDANFGVEARFYVVVDMAGLTVAGPQARKYMAKEPRTKLILAIVFVNASFHMRIVMTMFHKALQMINGQGAPPMAFVATIAEAHRWIQAHRKH